MDPKNRGQGQLRPETRAAADDRDLPRPTNEDRAQAGGRSLEYQGNSENLSACEARYGDRSVCAYTPALQTHSQTPIFTPIYIKFRVYLPRGVRQTSGETSRPAVRRSLPARLTAGVSAYRRREAMPSRRSRLHSTGRAHLRHSCSRELVCPTDRALAAAGCVPSALQQCAISRAGASPHRRLASLNKRMGRAPPPATLLAGRCRGPVGKNHWARARPAALRARRTSRPASHQVPP
jgi:hypothetical protein